MLRVINSKSEENQGLEVQNQDLKVKEREPTHHNMSTQIKAQVSRVSALEQDLRDTRVLLNMKEREVATKMEEISTKDSVLEARREVEALGLEFSTVTQRRYVWGSMSECPCIPRLSFIMLPHFQAFPWLQHVQATKH